MSWALRSAWIASVAAALMADGSDDWTALIDAAKAWEHSLARQIASVRVA